MTEIASGETGEPRPPAAALAVNLVDVWATVAGQEVSEEDYPVELELKLR